MTRDQILNTHGNLGALAQVFCRLTRNATAASLALAAQPDTYQRFALQDVKEARAYLDALERDLQGGVGSQPQLRAEAA